jgi:hypothetical protein
MLKKTQFRELFWRCSSRSSPNDSPLRRSWRQADSGTHFFRLAWVLWPLLLTIRVYFWHMKTALEVNDEIEKWLRKTTAESLHEILKATKTLLLALSAPPKGIARALLCVQVMNGVLATASAGVMYFDYFADKDDTFRAHILAFTCAHILFTVVLCVVAKAFPFYYASLLLDNIGTLARHARTNRIDPFAVGDSAGLEVLLLGNTHLVKPDELQVLRR